MVWFSTLFHRIYLSACYVVQTTPRREHPPSHCTPVCVKPVGLYPPTSASTSPLTPTTPPKKARPQPSLNLLSLPDDLLREIVHHVTHSDHESPAQGALLVVDERSYRSSVALTQTCVQLARHFHHSLDNVCLSTPAVSDDVIRALARNSAQVLIRLVLRGCTGLTDHALYALASHARALRSLDLSFLPSVTDEGVAALCHATAPRLRTLLLRRCAGVGDYSLIAIAECRQLVTLDVSYCPDVSDRGVMLMVAGCGEVLRLLAMSHNSRLTDRALEAVGKHCQNLTQLCARGLPEVTDVGFVRLCEGVGRSIEGIDVTECASITRDATLSALRTYCAKIYAHVMPAFASKSLRQILVSTLRQNIFIVHGSDPSSGRDTVHTVLIDNGDIVSASLLSSGTTDLSMLGIVLCKSYGSALDEGTKRVLEADYGIPTSSLAD